MAIIKTIDLTGSALDWAVAIAEGIPAEDIRIQGSANPIFRYLRDEDGNLNGRYMTGPDLLFSKKWEAGGPIIDAAQISIIRCDDDYEVDKRGFCTSKRIPVWAAVLGERHSVMEQYGSQGDCFGSAYEVNADAICGPIPLVAAMRCYVASKLGDEIDIPKELIA